MASLVRTWITTHEDPKTGKRVPAGTPGAVIRRTRSRMWYGQGIPGIHRRVPLARSKAAAQVMLADLLKRAERQKAGLLTEEEERQGKLLAKPLLEWLPEHMEVIRASNPVERYVVCLENQLRRMLDGLGWRHLRDADPDRLAVWLARRRREKRRFGVRTSNTYQDAMKGFLGFVARKCGVQNPLASAERLEAGADLRRPRRTVTLDELRRLLSTTLASPHERMGLAPRRRWLLYLLAAWTGRRLGALAGLVRSSLDLDAVPPVLRLPGKLDKARKERTVPLHPGLVGPLREHLGDLDPGDRLFPPGRWRKEAAQMLACDLEVAGIPYQDAEGRYFDFHALRGQFVTELARQGVHPRVAQELVGHTTMDMTMRHYTRVGGADLAEGIGRLPGPSEGVQAPTPREVLTLAVVWGAVLAALLGAHAQARPDQTDQKKTKLDTEGANAPGGKTGKDRKGKK